MSSEKIIDGVKIIETDDGHTIFKPIEEPKNESEKEKVVIDTRNNFEKLYEWWDNLKVKPYIKVRDLADPFNERTDIDAGSDGKNAIEAGIKIKF